MADTYNHGLYTSEPNKEAVLSGLSISTNLDNFEAARSAFFVFEVDGLDNIARVEYTGATTEVPGNNYKFAKASESIRLNVTKCDVPHFSLSALEYRRGNDTIKFAGLPTFNAGSITVDDVLGLETKSILMAWQNLAYNVRTRKGGRMADYKKTGTLMEYTQDYQLVRTWTLYGCWISDISEGAFDKASDEKRELSATIQYDRAVSEDAIVQNM